MLALVTGASSGIGRDIAIYLNQLGWDLIIVARDSEKLESIKKELNKNKKGTTEIIIADLSKADECKKVYSEVKYNHKSIDLLVNNAGFGLYGEFYNSDLDKELSMIDVNIKAVHILTKLFLKDMIAEDNGKILNVASIAGFMPGPLMATYYATKAYVVRFSQAIKEELTKKKSKVTISVLCPGPVDTNFNNVANVKFNLKSISSQVVAKYAIDQTLKGKTIILPGIAIKFTRFFAKVIPDSVMAKACYNTQEKKSIF